VKGSPEIALDGTRRPAGSRRVALEIVVWLIAFGLLLCQPAERSAGDTGRTDPARTSASR
jgi:hypothetical protein